MHDPKPAQAELPPFKKLNWLKRDIELERRAGPGSKAFAGAPRATTVGVRARF